MSLLHEGVTLALAVLAGLGVGSGGIYLLWLTEILQMSREDGILANLYFFIAALLPTAVIHWKRKRLDLPFLGQLLLLGFAGVFLGRWLAALLSPSFLRIFLGMFLIFSGIFSIFVMKKNKKA